MRVLQVCPRYPPQAGGVETHVAELSERLVERGHEVTVHTADARQGGRRRETRNGVRVRRHVGIAPGDAFHVPPGMFGPLRREEADVVHAHNYHSVPLVVAGLAAGDRRFVATTHYHGATANPVTNVLLRLYRPVGGFVLRGADDVVAVSGWEREVLADHFGVDATVVPNGIDVDRFRGATPEDRDRPYLLCVGRLEAYKGVQHLVRALPDLPGYDLVVAGRGPYRSHLQRLAGEVGVADRVDFPGFVDDDRLPGLYAGAAAYVTLSELESYGLTVGEALAAGTPAVVRPTRALADWTDRDAVVAVDGIDPPAVASAVETASGLTVGEPDLPTWDGMADRVEELYRG